MSEKPIKSYKEFWPFYLNEHARPATRAIHLAGTGAAIAMLGAAVLTGQWWLPVAAVAAGYGSAWTAHAFVEKNKPATFTYPLWSLASDFKMLGHFLTGTLGREVEKHVAKKPDVAPVEKTRPPKKSVMARLRGLKSSFVNAVSRKAKPPAPKPAAPQP